MNEHDDETIEVDTFLRGRRRRCRLHRGLVEPAVVRGRARGPERGRGHHGVAAL